MVFLTPRGLVLVLVPDREFYSSFALFQGADADVDVR